METLSGKALSKIGIGSFGVGGRGHRDVVLTEKQDDISYVSALAYTLDKGANFTEISLGYGHGNSMTLFKRALDVSSVEREDIFFTHSLYPRDLESFATVKDDLEGFHKVMGTNYADSTLVTQGLVIIFGEEKVYSLLHSLLADGKTRFVSLSNASPEFIRSFKTEFGDKFIAHEGHLSFEVRVVQDKGVFDVCDDLGVKNIIWRPLRRTKTMNRNWPLLTDLSKKYGKTQNQIVLNWICNLGYSPMVMSANKEHVDENLSSNDFQMSIEDCDRMNNFRPENFDPQVSWDTARADDDIVAAVNGF